MTQLTIFDAIAARDRAFARIEQADPAGAWRTGAYAFLTRFAFANRGREVTGEDMVDAYDEAGLCPPGDGRWWGPVIRRAAKQGLIEATGRIARRRKGHGTSGAVVWRVKG